MLTPEDVLRRPLVFSHPAMEQVQVQTDLVYKRSTERASWSICICRPEPPPLVGLQQ